MMFGMFVVPIIVIALINIIFFYILYKFMPTYIFYPILALSIAVALYMSAGFGFL